MWAQTIFKVPSSCASSSFTSIWQHTTSLPLSLILLCWRSTSHFLKGILNSVYIYVTISVPHYYHPLFSLRMFRRYLIFFLFRHIFADTYIYKLILLHIWLYKNVSSAIKPNKILIHFIYKLLRVKSTCNYNMHVSQVFT